MSDSAAKEDKEWLPSVTDGMLSKFRKGQKTDLPFLCVVHEEFDLPASPSRFVHADVFTSLDFARTWPHLFRWNRTNQTLSLSTASSTDTPLRRWSAEWFETERQFRLTKGVMTGDRNNNLMAHRLDSFGRVTNRTAPGPIATFMELVLPHGSLPVMMTLHLLADNYGTSLLETVLKLYPALKKFDYPGSIVDPVLAALEPIDPSGVDVKRLEPLLDLMDDNDFCRLLRLKTNDGRTLIELWPFSDLRTAPKMVRRFMLLSG